MICLLCSAQASRKPLCDGHWASWSRAPEAQRAEQIARAREPRAQKRVEVAVMDFVNRVRAEATVAGRPVP
jgi:hypothetical protein